MDLLQLLFLGTSSATPTKERNLSAVAVMFDGRAILFDCGEGTQHRMMHAPVRPGSIEAILLTHLHGDHLYGLPGLIAAIGSHGRTERLEVYGPPGLRRFLDAALGASQLLLPFELTIHEIDAGGDVRRAAGYRIIAAPLDHVVPAYGYTFIEDDRPGHFDVERARGLGVPEGPQYARLKAGQTVTLSDGRAIDGQALVGPRRRGRRIAYCTDTRPCKGAIDLARDADILVHESTYAEDLAKEADERGHSTAAGAASVARAAGAKRLLLTHFSPRYRDPAQLLAEARQIFPQTEAASDYLEITMT